MSSTFDGHHALSACCSDNRGEHGTWWQGIELANDLKITNRKKSLNDEFLEVNVAILRKISSAGCGEENENDMKNENNDFTKSMNEKKYHDNLTQKVAEFKRVM